MICATWKHFLERMDGCGGDAEVLGKSWEDVQRWYNCRLEGRHWRALVETSQEHPDSVTTTTSIIPTIDSIQEVQFSVHDANMGS